MELEDRRLSNYPKYIQKIVLKRAREQIGLKREEGIKEANTSPLVAIDWRQTKEGFYIWKNLVIFNQLSIKQQLKWRWELLKDKIWWV